MRRRPYGPVAWIVDEVNDPAAWAAGVRMLATGSILDVVPAEDTVVVTCRPGTHAEVGALLDAVTEAELSATAGSTIEIAVIYDGEDLDAVARMTGLSHGDVVSLHAAPTYTVAFCGFSPGFAYLRGLDDRLHVPRRPTPRTVVPAGSVAIAAGYSAVYPSMSPGGWHLLGRTEFSVWDIAQERPTLLEPGRAVRFRQVQP